MKLHPRPVDPVDDVGAGLPTRVVLIDDDPDMREVTRLALTRGGFDVVAEAGDGGSGIWAVRQHRPDVVLTDITMPVLGGLDALPTLRRLVPDASIVFFSSHDIRSKLGSIAHREADGYLVKGTARPRDVVELVARCRSSAGAAEETGLGRRDDHPTPHVVMGKERARGRPPRSGGNT